MSHKLQLNDFVALAKNLNSLNESNYYFSEGTGTNTITIAYSKSFRCLELLSRKIDYIYLKGDYYFRSETLHTNPKRRIKYYLKEFKTEPSPIATFVDMVHAAIELEDYEKLNELCYGFIEDCSGVVSRIPTKAGELVIQPSINITHRHGEIPTFCNWLLRVCQSKPIFYGKDKKGMVSYLDKQYDYDKFKELEAFL